MILTPNSSFVGPVAYSWLAFRALDFAGTYGVLVLFGIVPAAMAWSERYNESTLSRTQIVPGTTLCTTLIEHFTWIY